MAKRKDGFGFSGCERGGGIAVCVQFALEPFPGFELVIPALIQHLGDQAIGFHELFTYAIEQLEGAGIGFLHIMDGLGFGFHELSEPMTVEAVRPMFSGILIGNVGYTQASAEEKITAGQADLIAFGRPCIANPSLVERFLNGGPLAPEADMTSWLSHDEVGCIDWPAYSG